MADEQRDENKPSSSSTQEPVEPQIFVACFLVVLTIGIFVFLNT